MKNSGVENPVTLFLLQFSNLKLLEFPPYIPRWLIISCKLHYCTLVVEVLTFVAYGDKYCYVSRVESLKFKLYIR
jgi:hypothetical protein